MFDQFHTISNLPVKDFAEVYSIIRMHRHVATTVVNNESLTMFWEVGGYVSRKLRSSQWGESVVRNLAEYITAQDPTSRGWSYRSIYRMVDLYETYSSDSFHSLLNRINSHPETAINTTCSCSSIVTRSLSQLADSSIVTIELAQIPEILFAIGWSNHLTIMARCKNDEERLFYILYAHRENLKNKELERAIKTHTMEALLSNNKAITTTLQDVYPQSDVQFKDRVYLDFLGLPKMYKESRLRKGIVQHMKEFILELGSKEFLFIDEEHILDVNGHPYKADLLFYHMRLQCMVVIELKTTEYHPAYRSQLEFYLEVLDQEEKLSCENPSIGIILCKESDMEVVRYSLNRSISPLMVMQYEEQIRPGSVLQRSLVEYCKCINTLPK